MSCALVPVYFRRPPFLTVQAESASAVLWPDGRISQGHHGPVIQSIATHDQYYLRTKSSWKRVLLLGGRLSETIAEYHAWLESERAAYEALGLFPPQIRKHRAGRLKRSHCLRGHDKNIHGRRDRYTGYLVCRLCRKAAA